MKRDVILGLNRQYVYIDFYSFEICLNDKRLWSELTSSTLKKSNREEISFILIQSYMIKCDMQFNLQDISKHKAQSSY